MSWLEGTVRETDGNSCKQRQRLTSLKLTFPVELFSSVIVGGVCEAGIKVDDIYWETVPSKYFEIFFTKISKILVLLAGRLITLLAVAVQRYPQIMYHTPYRYITILIIRV